MMSNNSHNLFFREIYNLSSLLETSPDLFGESSVLRVSHEANRTVYVRDNSVRYVTDSKDAGAELENWSHSDIIKASPIGIVVLDASQTVIDVNPEFCRLFELGENLIYSKNINKLSSRFYPNLDLSLLQPDTHNIRKLVKSNGSSSYVSVSHRQILRNDNITGLSALYVTDIKEIMDVEFSQKGDLNDLAQKNIDLLIKNKILEKQSMTDYLTGLSNRRSMHVELAKEIDRVDRFAGNGLSLLLIDVDFFKKYNDTFGHVQGDRVLQAVASSLQSSSRSYDCISRYGGEEFAVILPNTDLRAAFRVAERMRSGIERVSFGGQNITISIGIGFWSKGMSEEALINDADSALYTAKQNGRNTVFPKIRASHTRKKI